MKPFLVVLGALLTSVLGCTSEQAVELDPPDDVLFSMLENASRVGRVDSGPDLESPTALVAELRAARRIGQLGSLSGGEDGEKTDVFGDVGPVRLWGDTVAVGDLQGSTIRLFGWNGSALGSLGRPGDGPGEFRALSSFSRLGGDSILVLSERPGFQIFGPLEDGSLGEVDRFSLPTVSHAGAGLYGGGVCVVGDAVNLRTMSHGVPGSDRIHVVGLRQREVVSSFGSIPYASALAAVNMIMSEGFLACHPTESLAVVASTGLPFLDGFDLQDGSLLWRVEFPDEEFGRISVRDRRFVSVPGQGLRFWSVVEAPQGMTVVQLAKASASAVVPDTIFTYVIDSRGNGVFAGTSLPLIKSIARERFVALELSPFPLLGLYEVNVP